MMEKHSTSKPDIKEKNPQNPTASSSSGGGNRRDPRSIGVGGTHPAGFMGKHRMAAAIAYLDQQTQIIQEELDQLETLGEASSVCSELITSIESVPDALLPVTRGPVEVGWDRWFQGGHGSKNRKRWI